MTRPTTRNANSDSQSLGSWTSSVWYGGRKKKSQAKKASTAATIAGSGAAGAGDEHDDEQVEQRPLAFGERVSAGRNMAVDTRDRQDGQPVAVASEPGDRRRSMSTSLVDRYRDAIVRR